MRARLLLGMTTLLTTTVACSQATAPKPTVATTPTIIEKPSVTSGKTVPGSYIVKAPGGDGAAAIRRVFAQYGVVLVNPLGNEQFELRLERDPGLEALKGLVSGSGGAVTAVQPNFVYRAY